MKLKDTIKQTATTQQIKKIKQQQHHKIILGGLGCCDEFVTWQCFLYLVIHKIKILIKGVCICRLDVYLVRCENVSIEVMQ